MSVSRPRSPGRVSQSPGGARPGGSGLAAEPRPDEPGLAAEPRPDEPAAASKPRPDEPVPAADSGRGEPAPAAQSRPSEPSPAAKPFSVWEKAPEPSQERDRTSGRGSDQDDAYQPEHAEPPSADTQQKLEQLKDLYLTAEAIGEDALVKHFDELSQMQRSLISEFFEKAGLGPKGKSALLGDASAQDDASLPG